MISYDKICNVQVHDLRLDNISSVYREMFCVLPTKITVLAYKTSIVAAMFI